MKPNKIIGKFIRCQAFNYLTLELCRRNAQLLGEREFSGRALTKPGPVKI